MMKISSLLVSLLVSFSAFAEDAASSAAAPGAAPKQPGTFEMMVPFVGMFAVMYFLMIRPQQKRAKEQQTLLSGLKQGDEVVTTSGILGKVNDITEKVVTIEIDRNVKVRMLKSQVAQIVKADTLTASTT